MADHEAGDDKMSEDEIAAQLRTLVQAGYETVSSAIAVSSPSCRKLCLM